MARPLRVEFPGAIYHVTARIVGSWRDERLRLFRDSRDYQGFLERLGEGVGELGVRVYLFCLMGNHFHLMLETCYCPNSRRNFGRIVVVGFFV